MTDSWLYLLLLWPVAGWVGGVWAVMREGDDVRLEHAVMMVVFGATAGPLFPLSVLCRSRYPIVLIRARKR